MKQSIKILERLINFSCNHLPENILRMLLNYLEGIIKRKPHSLNGVMLISMVVFSLMPLLTVFDSF